MFNPKAKLEIIEIDGERPCLVIDDFMSDPESWVARANTFRQHFKEPQHNAYPGHELRMPEEITLALVEAMRPWFKQHFGVRRILDAYSRLSMVTRRPEQLEPRQWICHRDRLKAAPGRMALASMLYLFKDADLGGTKLYRPRQSALATDILVHDSSILDSDAFSSKYSLLPGYLTGSNAYFEEVLDISAKWNRLVIYDGMIFHSADIRHPERMLDDPKHGRLSLNGFFTGRLPAA